jgi:2-phospho-L-lactate guanylyltransferase
MTQWAVVPVKPLGRAKSRLAQVLGYEERLALSASLLVHTLDALSQAGAVERIAVVSRDPQVRRMANQWQALFIEEPEGGGLNQALEMACHHARSAHASSVLVLPADLPRLSADDIDELLGLSEGVPSIVLAPDRHGSGTNALLQSPPGLIEYAFGPLSFMRHLQLAEAAGVQPHICRSSAFTLDLDLPDDLKLLAGSAVEGPSGG